MFDPGHSIASLQQYQRPEVFLAEVSKSQAVSDERFFNDSRLKKLQEAWVAGHFSRSLEIGGHDVALRLVGDQARFPDFQLRFNGSEREFEVVSAIKPNRKLGAEYKLREKDPYLLTPFRPHLGEKRGPCWVAVAIHRKAKKYYADRVHLLVYANFEANTLDLKRVLELSDASLTKFSSVWVLWGKDVGKVYDTGMFPQPDLEWIHES